MHTSNTEQKKDLITAIRNLKEVLKEAFNIELEFIKVDKQVHNIKSLEGVGIKPIIYEHEATYYLKLSKEKTNTDYGTKKSGTQYGAGV